jgi:hypothetical protein
MEMDVPVYAQGGQGDTKDTIVRQDDDFFFAGEIEVEDVVVAEVFRVTGLTEGVLAVGYKVRGCGLAGGYLRKGCKDGRRRLWR